MWFDKQNCAMMGLQTTSSAVVNNKRKFETWDYRASPSKISKWDVSTSSDDCIARLQAVAVPSPDAWYRFPSAVSEENCTFYDFDDLSSSSDDDMGRCSPEPPRFRATTGPLVEPPRFSAPTPAPLFDRLALMKGWQNSQQQQQQTISRDENGKSYFELGAAPKVNNAALRCCDGRARWCQVQTFKQRRLAMINLSISKLTLYKDRLEHHLQRSVVVHNTVARLQREMADDPPEPSYPLLPELPAPNRVSPVFEASGYEQSLRDMAGTSGRATPFPASTSDTDSGLGDDDYAPTINWSSVLLSSHLDLEPMNNHDLYAELGLNASNSCQELSSTLRTDSLISDQDAFVQILIGTNT
ncbi:uncharacterized protein LOC109537229 isoform X1 [Dendroctonus ponderosae]|uniref:SERTA domain-containing protein n=2 Tax=Dendroctonus ponderosae TaxID=77166 RepID=A0AAR5PED7_DENPD|nr:uncharacterized protein LOC109537229 isoform X1 [Dendroctonus ponderosae]